MQSVKQSLHGYAVLVYKELTMLQLLQRVLAKFKHHFQLHWNAMKPCPLGTLIQRCTPHKFISWCHEIRKYMWDEVMFYPREGYVAASMAVKQLTLYNSINMQPDRIFITCQIYFRIACLVVILPHILCIRDIYLS